MSTAQFHDGLADTYHALYGDWRAECAAQGAALHRLLSRWHPGPADIADVACGIGTQLIGLAGLGHRVPLAGSPTGPEPAARQRLAGFPRRRGPGRGGLVRARGGLGAAQPVRALGAHGLGQVHRGEGG